MNAKTPVTGTSWIDPDDAPELTGEEMDRPDAVWSIGGRQVTPAEGKAAFRAMLGVGLPSVSVKDNDQDGLMSGDHLLDVHAAAGRLTSSPVPVL